MNPYDILGIARGAGRKEITSAFRRLVKDCHPDNHPGDDAAAAKFIRLKAAYDAAIKELDNPRPEKPPFKASRRDARREVAISIAEAVRGKTVRIEGASGPCKCCAGEGFVRSNEPVECHTCGGSGISGYKERGIIRVKTACPDCGGSGRTMRVQCVECFGFGSSADRDLEIDLPPGCSDGDVFTVKGGMSDPLGNVVGDLEIVVRIRNDGEFRLVDDDIETTVGVEVWEAALGTSRTIAAPGGRKFRLSIPAGSRHGRRFRLKGQGLNGGDVKGDFVVVLDVRIPDASEGKAKEAFERLRDALSG